MLAIPFPHIDPYIIHVGPLGVTWYSLSYVAGIIIGWQYALYLINKTSSNIKQKDFDDLITWLIIGIIVGGRLGYVFLYEPAKYLSNPIEILKTYEGGMAFHGGLLGVMIASYSFCYVRKIRYLELIDILATVAPIGLFLGRIANFINAELYGSPTSMPWGVVFPGAGELPRHPSQIYEAISEGLILCLVMGFFMLKLQLYKRVGCLSGIFAIGYALSRFICEFYRVPDFEFLGLTSGQLYSIPMFLVGGYLVYCSGIKSWSCRTS